MPKQKSDWRFNTPPGWPEPPSDDWLPPDGWWPDPTYPPAPEGWEWYLPVVAGSSPETAMAVVDSSTAGSEPSKREQKQLRAEEKRRRQEDKSAERAADELARGPVGQARDALKAGERIYQVVLPVTQRKHVSGTSINPNGTRRADVTSHAVTLSQIEDEGWELDNVGYVYEETGQVSRDKFLSSGQETVTTGRVLGIYLFRAGVRAGQDLTLKDAACHTRTRDPAGSRRPYALSTTKRPARPKPNGA